MKVFASYMAVNSSGDKSSQVWGNFYCYIDRLDDNGLKEVQAACKKVIPEGYMGILINVIKLDEPDIDKWIEKMDSSL